MKIKIYDDEVVVYSNKRTVWRQKKAKRILVHTGNVDARSRDGEYRMQADKITVIEAKDLFIAEGNVIFDQGNDQRITGTRAEWNYKTKLGYFVDSTGFTNQTSDGTIIYWMRMVEKFQGKKFKQTLKMQRHNGFYFQVVVISKKL